MVQIAKAVITKHTLCGCQHSGYTPGPVPCLIKMRSLKKCVSVLLAVRTHPQPRHPWPVDLEEAMRLILGERAAEGRQEEERAG